MFYFQFFFIEFHKLKFFEHIPFYIKTRPEHVSYKIFYFYFLFLMKSLRLAIKKHQLFFDVPIQERLSLSMPINKNRFFLLVEKTTTKDYQVSLDTFLQLINGKVVAHAHSDDPCSILFKTGPSLNDSIFNFNGFTFDAKITSNEKNIAESKISCKTKFPNPFTEKEDEIFAKPSIKGIFLERPFNFHNIDLQFKTTFKYRDFGLSFLLGKSPFVLKISPFANSWFGQHYLGLNFGPQGFSPALASYFTYNQFEFSLNTEFSDRSIHLHTIYSLDQIGKFGGSFEVKHIGHGPEFVAKVASDIKIDENSNIKLVACSNRKISAQITVPYNNFLKMVFASELLVKGNKPYTRFGASIFFYQ